MAEALRHQGAAEELMAVAGPLHVVRPADAPEEGGRTAPSFLVTEGLTKRFGAAIVVRDVSIAIGTGEFVCILGPSGCGKTTLLRLIAGFEQADAGAIRQAGRDITALPPEARDFGIVFQSYALFPNRDVAGNIAFGLESTGIDRATRARRVAELLALVGLAPHAGKYPSQLSGGQQQRVALARALALSPGLLLLDEPLSALDANVRAALRDELRALQRRLGVTAVMVTHDQQEALSIADRLIVMRAGAIEQVGTPMALYQQPANLFVARFLGDMNALPVEAAQGMEIRAAGMAFRLGAPVGTVPPRAVLCFRPAAVSLGAEMRGAANAVPARVVSAGFRGDVIRVLLAPEAAPELRIEAEIPSLRPVPVPEPGERVVAGVQPAHLLLLAGEG
jgi:iron(III) transport system ATP-binding protein